MPTCTPRVHRARATIRRTLLGLALGAGAAQATCPETPAPRAPRDFVAAAAKVAPSVATIVVLKPVRDPARESGGPAFFQSMQLASPGSTLAAERTFSSGFTLDADGAVLTSAHSVAGAVETWVLLADGRSFAAEIAGLDRKSDVALLTIPASGLPVAQASPSGTCAGAWVAALGAPFGFETSVSAGVVSAYPRVLPGSDVVPLIQTDVPLNPGSSGGPLFDSQGRVVGMNSMIYSDRGSFLGVSFAVPIATVMRAAAELRRTGRVRWPDIGARLQPVGPQLAAAFGLPRAQGALVTTVRADGPAALAGIASGDVLVTLDGKPIASDADAAAAIDAAAPGELLQFELWRDGALQRRQVRTGERAADMPLPVPRQPRAAETRLGLVLYEQNVKLPPGVHVLSASGSSLLAGLDTGDRITAVNGRTVATAQEFDAQLAAHERADVVALLVWREGSPLYVAVRKLGR